MNFPDWTPEANEEHDIQDSSDEEEYYDEEEGEDYEEEAMESDDSGEIGYIENSQTPSQMTPMDNSSDDTQQTK